MAEDCSRRLEEAMERNWFHRNVLLPSRPPEYSPLREEGREPGDGGRGAAASGRRRRSASSSSPTESGGRRRARAMRRYKSFSELEEEEVKGFVDLGFVFNKETISPRMMRVVPGLQRLGEVPGGGEAAPGGEERKGRPYLAEAWLVNGPSRPPSPLLNLRTLPASPSECADVRRNIRFWARSVASAVQQESS